MRDIISNEFLKNMCLKIISIIFHFLLNSCCWCYAYKRVYMMINKIAEDLCTVEGDRKGNIK